MKTLTLGTICFLLLMISATSYAQVDVLTQHNDLKRTGWNNQESVLSPSSISATTFGMLFFQTLDDQTYSQPLVVSGVHGKSIPASATNVLYVTTVNNSIYAFDADNGQIPFYWHINLTPANMRPPVNSDIHACGTYRDISGQFGIVGTPVIDKATQTLYVVSRYVNPSQVNGDAPTGFYQQLHAIDLLDGSEKFGGPVQIAATYPGGAVFDPRKANQRAGLLLLNGMVYISYASHCDWNLYHGWVLGYSASDLTQRIVYCATPNAGRGGIWQSGAAPAADAAGNIFVATGNSENADDAGSAENRGESILKLTPNASKTAFDIIDYWTPSNYKNLNNGDLDFGTQVLLVPNQDMLVTGCKNGSLFLTRQSSLGGYSPTSDQILQEVPVAGGAQMHSSLAYFAPSSGAALVYQFSENTKLTAYPVNGNSLGGGLQSSISGPTGSSGAYMSVSSPQDASSGVLWASHAANGCDANQNVCHGILQAVDANNVNNKLWDSEINTADDAGNFAKNVCPTIANGKVYLATFSNKINVYGLTANNQTCAVNVAIGKTGIISPAQSNQSPATDPSDALDDNANTSWVSDNIPGGGITYTVDLGASYDICRVVINWEDPSEGSNFTIQTSPDNVDADFVTVASFTNNTLMTNSFTGTKTARYVRMNGATGVDTRFRIKEFQVFGQPANVCTSPTNLAATAITSASMHVAWTAVPTATSYLLSYKPTKLNSWITRTTTGTSVDLSALSANTPYDIKVEATCGAGTSADALLAATTAVDPNQCLLFTRWDQADMGDIGIAGTSCFTQQGNGTTVATGYFTVTGSGNGITGQADQFQNAWNILTGDQSWVARIASISGPASTTAGVMMRDSLSTTSKFAFIGINNGVATFKYRDASGTNVVTLSGSAIAPPYYVMLTKSGTTFTGFVSPTGLDQTWTQVGSGDASFGGTNAMNIGYAVSSGVNASTAVAVFDLDGPVALPINLASFDAKLVDDKYVAINWVTSQEVNNDYFEIQHSTDGLHFDDLVQVKAVGNSSTPQSYATADNNPANGLNFYRLKQVDLDGKSSYFPAVTVKFGKATTPIVFPNPMVAVVNVVAGDDGIQSLGLYDVSGKKVNDLDNAQGNSKLVLSVDNLPAGIYILKIKTANKVYQRKLIKQ